MTHNRYDAYEDIIRPLMSFFAAEEILVQEPKTAPNKRLNDLTNFENAESAAQNHQFLQSIKMLSDKNSTSRVQDLG